MTAYQYLTAAFYLALALFAAWAIWPHRDRRILGVGMVAAWVASNAIWCALPLKYHPVLFPIIDILFGLLCASVWLVTKSRITWVLVALSALAASMNAAYSFAGWPPSDYRTHVYEIALNIIFAAQCLVIAGWGRADELARVLGFLRRRPDPGYAAQHHGRSAEK